MWAWVRIPLLTNVFRKYEIANIRLVCIEFAWIPQEYSWIRVRIHCVERFRQFSKTENAHGVTPIAIFELSSGELAQMVERSLSMREIPGSIPGSSIPFFLHSHFDHGLWRYPRLSTNIFYSSTSSLIHSRRKTKQKQKKSIYMKKKSPKNLVDKYRWFFLIGN